jgi:hypothetical protein
MAKAVEFSHHSLPVWERDIRSGEAEAGFTPYRGVVDGMEAERA